MAEAVALDAPRKRPALVGHDLRERPAADDDHVARFLHWLGVVGREAEECGSIRDGADEVEPCFRGVGFKGEQERGVRDKGSGRTPLVAIAT